MAKCSIQPIWLVLFWLAAPSGAALYELTFEGHVTESNLSNVNVGDPFTIRTVSDSHDVNSSPTMGTYLSTLPTMAFPNASITVTGPPVLYLNVTLNDAGESDRILGLHFYPNVSVFTLDILFPAGTLESDALPLTLPLSSATTSTFWFGYLGPFVVGDITAYTTVEIPEPGAGLLMAIIGLGRRKLSRHDRVRSRLGNDSRAILNLKSSRVAINTDSCNSGARRGASGSSSGAAAAD